MKRQRPLVVFLPDSGRGSGRGHVARCAALAHAIRASGGRTLTLLPPSEPVHAHCGSVRRAEWHGHGCLGRSHRIATEGLRPGAWVVDSYRIRPGELRMLRAVAPVWVPMDVPRRRAGADGTWAPLPHPHGTGSDVDAANRLFGPRYAILPPRLGVASRAGRGRHVVVSFGSEDHRGLTVPMAKRLADGGWHVLAVVGAGVQHRTSCVGALSSIGPRVRVVDGRRGLVSALRRAGWAVLAPGQSMWEALGLGLPTVLVETSRNQAPGRAWACRVGIAVDAGRATAGATERVADALARLLESPGRVARMRSRTLHALDGRGRERIARAILASTPGAQA